MAFRRLVPMGDPGGAFDVDTDINFHGVRCSRAEARIRGVTLEKFSDVRDPARVLNYPSMKYLKGRVFQSAGLVHQTPWRAFVGRMLGGRDEAAGGEIVIDCRGECPWPRPHV